MSSRTKRGRIYSSANGNPLPRSASSASFDSSLNLFSNGFEAGSSHFECGSFASKCSVRLVYEVISNFDSEKSDLVKEIGFGGILHFPSFKQIHRKFALWLMTSVDEPSSSLHIGQHIRIPFTSTDIAHVFGIPSSGFQVSDDLVSSKEAKDYVLSNILGAGFKESRSIKYVQQILELQYSSPMSKVDKDRWKVAFVVFVASNLLCPSSKHDYASIDYWNAIKDPDKIATFNWAEYVKIRLLEAVKKLKQDISCNIKFPNISGCSIFLQVFYLDSLDLGSLGSSHNSLPRVREFPFDKVRTLINADTNFSLFLNPDQDLPITKLRSRTHCIYYWAQVAVETTPDSRTGCLLAIWESAVAMVHLLNIPLEAAGPVFVAAADFQEQINSGLLVTGIQAIKFMTVLVSIMIPYRRGCTNHPSDMASSAHRGSQAIQESISNGTSLLSFPLLLQRRNNRHVADLVSLPVDTNHDNYNRASSSQTEPTCLQQSLIGDIVQRSFRSVTATLDELPHHLNVNLRVASSMSQFYSLLRSTRSPLAFDLNASADGSLHPRIIQSLCTKQSLDPVPPPWELGFSCLLLNSKSLSSLRNLNAAVDLDSLVIVHRSPRQIQVSLGQLRSQLLGTCEFDSDVFDALIRSIREQDDTLYASYGIRRWRYFFESDFMEAILSGSTDISTSSLIQLLSDSIATCDLSGCYHIFFPALLHCQWVCFVWSLRTNVISVFEPSYQGPVPQQRLQVIERSCFLIKLVLDTVVSSFIRPPNVDLSKIETRIMTLGFPPTTRFNRSGVLCAYFCRCFDGVDFSPKSLQIDCDAVASCLLTELSTLKNNYASFPHDLG